jgi:hypothetical protein
MHRLFHAPWLRKIQSPFRQSCNGTHAVRGLKHSQLQEPHVAWKTMATRGVAPVLVAALAIAALAQGVRAIGVN